MSDINYEMIQQYLEGELSGDALRSFEEQMRNDPALAEEVALYKGINEEMLLEAKSKKEEQALSINLEKLNEQYFKKQEGKVRRISRWWYAGAAAAAAVISILILRPFSDTSFNNEKLYAHYSKEVDPLPGGNRGNPADSLQGKAADLYNKQDYANALPLLRNLIADKPKETQLKLAMGICLLQTGQYDSSNIIFDEIAAGATIFKNEAVWYKALSSLKQNKLDECYRLLGTIPADAGKYDEAQELMKKINKQLKKE
jgi:predicted Zn-dependent protease